MAGRYFGEAAGAEKGDGGDRGIVAQVKEETGEDGAGAGAYEREDDANRGEDGDEAPSPAQLRAVHQAEEDAGDEDAGSDAEIFCEEWVQVAAEDSFFDKW